MKKVFGVFCVVVVCLCLFHNMFSVVSVGEDGFTTTFNIQAKLHRFANSQIFDYNEEMIELQCIEYYFESLANQGAAKQGESYIHYIITDTQDVPEYGYVPATLPIVDTDGENVRFVWRKSFEKGDFTFFGDFGNAVNSFVDLIVGCFRLVKAFFISMLQVIADIAKLAIDIVFLP